MSEGIQFLNIVQLMSQAKAKEENKTKQKQIKSHKGRQLELYQKVGSDDRHFLFFS